MGREQPHGVWERLWRNWIKPAIVIAAVVLPLKSAIADWNWVPTSSMKPTILEGDLVLVNKVAYDLKIPFTMKRVASWGNPVRGEIVVFFSKDGTRTVKRVIAGPGDTVEMRRSALFVNGKPLRYEMVPKLEEYEIYEDPRAAVAKETDGDKTHLIMVTPSFKAMRDFPPVKVPKDQYFVMGDSRDNSHDSRYFGMVERSAIIGRSARVLLSFDKNETLSPRFGRFFSALDPL